MTCFQDAKPTRDVRLQHDLKKAHLLIQQTSQWAGSKCELPSGTKDPDPVLNDLQLKPVPLTDDFLQVKEGEDNTA